jgi:exosortase/archaeosortase family protein
MKKEPFLTYLLKFILSFCILYYGTIAFIGISSPGGYYVSFADKYINYVAWLRAALLYCSKFVLELLHFKVYLPDLYTIKLENGKGVHIGYDCIGYGVLFFWIAFVFANTIPFVNKLKWMIGGVLLIWMINVGRVCLLVVAINQNWKSPFNFDNHTWFNMVAYTAIFTMIFFFDVAYKKHKTVEESSEG